MARVMVFTPTYNDLLQPETTASIEELQFNGELEWVLSDDNPYPGRDMRNCNYQFQKGRQMALDGGYDAMLIVEHDMIVPAHALQKLWDTPAPVVYGSYELRHGMHALNLWQYIGKNNLGMSLSLYPRELQAMRRRGYGRVCGCGFGCLLIRADAMRKVPFRETDNAPDLPFALDCVRKDVLCIGRTDVECGHIDTDDNNKVLWPFQEGGNGMLARVYSLQNVTIGDRQQSVVMTKGKYYSLSVPAARDAARAGYVQIMNEADIVADEMARETADMMPMETADSPVVKKRRGKRVSGDTD